MLMSLSYCGYKHYARPDISECSGYRRPKTQKTCCALWTPGKALKLAAGPEASVMVTIPTQAP